MMVIVEVGFFGVQVMRFCVMFENGTDHRATKEMERKKGARFSGRAGVRRIVMKKHCCRLNDGLISDCS